MRNFSSLPLTSARSSCDVRPSDVQSMPSPRPGFFSTVLAEFGRALTAARRYEDLRYRHACGDRLTPAEIQWQIFEEFYADRSNTHYPPRDVSGRDRLDMELRLRAWRAARTKVLVSSALSTVLTLLRGILRRAGQRAS
jgi:hypothetical protein